MESEENAKSKHLRVECGRKNQLSINLLPFFLITGAFFAIKVLKNNS
jgi:hypothetical protein